MRDNGGARVCLQILLLQETGTVVMKEAEKILKYRDLTVEIQGMWNVKTKVVPVI